MGALREHGEGAWRWGEHMEESTARSTKGAPEVAAQSVTGPGSVQRRKTVYQVGSVRATRSQILPMPFLDCQDHPNPKGHSCQEPEATNSGSLGTIPYMLPSDSLRTTWSPLQTWSLQLSTSASLGPSCSLREGLSTGPSPAAMEGRGWTRPLSQGTASARLGCNTQPQEENGHPGPEIPLVSCSSVSICSPSHTDSSRESCSAQPRDKPILTVLVFAHRNSFQVGSLHLTSG